MVRASFNINVIIQHVMGKHNDYADALSRTHMDKCSECIKDLVEKGYKQRSVDMNSFLLNTNW